jgi:hypothetical protein
LGVLECVEPKQVAGLGREYRMLGRNLGFGRCGGCGVEGQGVGARQLGSLAGCVATLVAARRGLLARVCRLAAAAMRGALCARPA